MENKVGFEHTYHCDATSYSAGYIYLLVEATMALCSRDVGGPGVLRVGTLAPGS